MAEMTIAVTGAGGQLGKELIRLQLPGITWIGLDRQALDITDAEACMHVIGNQRPDAVIHAAAYTAVDRAETEPETAYRINVQGTQNAAAAAELVGAKFVYVSTDYVFDGFGTRPYEVNDPTGPRTVYGRTKLQGEQAAAVACNRTFIVRTSWVYGAYGSNFVRTMLQLASNGTPLRVVNDQTGSPTYTYDLARFLTELVLTEQYGTYHASNSGSCTWYQFAQTIFAQSGLNVDLVPCTTAEFPRPAPRPAYSVLGHDSMRRAGFAPLRDWREGLKEFLTQD